MQRPCSGKVELRRKGKLEEWVRVKVRGVLESTEEPSSVLHKRAATMGTFERLLI